MKTELGTLVQSIPPSVLGPSHFSLPTSFTSCLEPLTIPLAETGKTIQANETGQGSFLYIGKFGHGALIQQVNR